MQLASSYDSWQLTYKQVLCAVAALTCLFRQTSRSLHCASFAHCSQGEATERIKVKRINTAVREGERLNIRVINYKKDGQAFLNHLQITPLRSGPLGEYTHMLGILEEEPLEEYTCKLRRT